MLCSTIKSESKDAIEQSNREADIIEFDYELLEKIDPVELKNQCRKPVIFKLIEPKDSLLTLSPDYIDLPHTIPPQVFNRIGRLFPKVKRICSFHDFEQTNDLEAILSQMHKTPAEFYKIATMARSTCDALRMLAFVKKNKCIGICMGELGVITRILSSCCGSPWTYAPICEEQKTAPGQLVLSELVNVYHQRCHSVQTALYGLIGDPVDQSISHRTHNWAFRTLGIDAVYVKMRVKEDELEHFLPLCRAIGFRGLSVTMPHKERVARYLNRGTTTLDQTPQFSNYAKWNSLSNLMKTSSYLPAINTLKFCEVPTAWFNSKTLRLSVEKQNHDLQGMQGWNTDGPGALDAVEKRVQVKNLRIAIIGAGGAAQGIAIEARRRGAHLIIFNRTYNKAQMLADLVDGEAWPLSDFSFVAKIGYDILINCTSVGMGENSRTPLVAEDLLERKIVMDIIISPQITPLLKVAKEKKCETIEGIEVFIQQAVGQFCHWFGVHK